MHWLYCGKNWFNFTWYLLLFLSVFIKTSKQIQLIFCWRLTKSILLFSFSRLLRLIFTFLHHILARLNTIAHFCGYGHSNRDWNKRRLYCFSDLLNERILRWTKFLHSKNIIDLILLVGFVELRDYFWFSVLKIDSTNTLIFGSFNNFLF